MILTQGEVREIGIEVVSQVKQDFIIEAADYVITKTDGTTIESGTATIDGRKILTLFSAQEVGKFYVWFIYRIGPEILKAKIYLEVMK